jgi:hypothetical protein
MSRVRINTPKNRLIHPPVCINFSEIEKNTEDIDDRFSPGDDGRQAEDVEESVAYESLICDILASLDDQDRIIFLLQIIRDCGYRIDHGSFAKSINMSRSKYMGLLSDIKIKISLYLIGERVRLTANNDPNTRL